MTYDEAVSYYKSFEKFGVVPGLDRVRTLCERLGSPHNALKAVHISGTNGKGTTCTEIACILKCAGYRTGLYTSPEVMDFRERMQINGEMIPENELCDLTDIVKSAVDSLNAEGIFPTQFEVVTAAAFLWFLQSKCDIVVLETGLGGRFDATNIISGTLVCGITSVSLDHISVLGNTLAEIAFEKSGIIKNSCSVVSSVLQKEEVKDVINREALKKFSETAYADAEKIFRVLSTDITGSSVLYRDTRIKIPFPGKHQLDNAAIAITVCDKLSEAGFLIPLPAVVNGIEKSRIPARIEIISEKPLVILDGSHNDGSTKALADVISENLKGKKIIAIMGMMADKDIEKSVGNLIPYFNKIITVKPSNPRALDAGSFARILNNMGAEACDIANPTEAADEAIRRLDSYDALVVCGSLYLAADIRKYLKSKFS